jgi:hypothetical protein
VPKTKPFFKIFFLLLFKFGVVDICFGFGK